MAKTINEPRISLAPTGATQPITEASIKDTVGASHWLYSRAGTHWVRKSFRPLFRTTNISYTQVNDSTDDYAGDLVCWPSQAAVRPAEDVGVIKSAVSLIVVGRNVTVSVKDYEGTMAPIEVSCGAAWEQAEAVGFTTASIEGKHLLIQAKVSSGTGYISAIHVIEKPLDAGELPTKVT